MLIKDIAKFNPKGTKSNEYINYVDTSSVQDGKLVDVQKLNSDFPSRAQRVISKNDILISSVRPNLKHNYCVNNTIINGVASTGFIQIRVFSEKVFPKYLYYFLTEENKVKMYQNIAETSQSTFPSFNKEVIENIDFPDVSLTFQQHIVDSIKNNEKEVTLCA